MSTSATTDRPYATLEGTYNGKPLSKRFPNEPSLVAYAEKLIRLGCKCRAGCAEGRAGPKHWINMHLSKLSSLICRIWCDVCQVEHRTIRQVYTCRKRSDPVREAKRVSAELASRKRSREYKRREKDEHRGLLDNFRAIVQSGGCHCDAKSRILGELGNMKIGVHRPKQWRLYGDPREVVDVTDDESGCDPGPVPRPEGKRPLPVKTEPPQSNVRPELPAECVPNHLRSPAGSTPAAPFAGAPEAFEPRRAAVPPVPACPPMEFMYNRIPKKRHLNTAVAEILRRRRLEKP